MRENHSLDEKIVTLSDIKRLFKQNARIILQFTIACAGIAFLLAIYLSYPRYSAEATFSEGGEKQEIEGLFNALMGAINVSGEAQAAMVMKSNLILKPLVQKLGLQAQVHKSRFVSKMQQMMDNVRAERKRKLPDFETFVFQNVLYEEETGKGIALHFLNNHSFEVLERGKVVAKGRLGEPVTLPGLAFTLVSVPSYVRKNKTYQVGIAPWFAVANGLKSAIEIKQNKINKNILHLIYKDRDRFLAAKIVNALMAEYQEFLKTENDKLAEEQLAYLENRQHYLNRNLEKGLDEHVAYLRQNLGERGFMGLDQEVYSLLGPHQQYVTKLYDLDLEEMHLEKEEQEEKKLPFVAEGPIADNIDRIANDIERLKSERDTLGLALHFSENEGKHELVEMRETNKLKRRLELVDFEMKKWERIADKTSQRVGIDDWSPVKALQQELLIEKDQILQKLKEKHTQFDAFETLQDKALELKKIRHSLSEADQLLSELSVGKMPDTVSLACDPGNLIKNWIELLRDRMDSRTVDLKQEREDFSSYLKNYSRLLSVREKMLQERVFPVQGRLPEFEGIDLDGARALYREYNNKLDELQISIRTLSFVMEQLKDPNFEISSLSGALYDGVSLEIIAKASQLALQLKDEVNRSNRDQKRLEDDLLFQRKFIDQHVAEMITVKKLSAEMIQDKITALMETTLDLINQQISVLNEQANDFIEARRINLKKEKSLILRKIEELKKEMSYIPEKWRLEHQMKLKTDIAIKMMQAMTQLVESKTVRHHLQQIQSKPLDLAIIPLQPQSCRLFLKTLLAMILGFLGIFSFKLIKALLHGFPVSSDTLLSLQQHVSGPVTAFCDGKEVDPILAEDLETLRKLSSFLVPQTPNVKEFLGLTLGIVGGKGPNYSFALADLLAKRGFKIMLVQCTSDGKFSNNEVPGLLQFLKKEVRKCPIRNEQNYDFLPFGGVDRYGVELLGGSTFLDLLQDFKKGYDVIILFSQAMPAFEEGKAFLHLADKAVITVQNETIEMLKPYTEWGRLAGSPRLSFITA